MHFKLPPSGEILDLLPDAVCVVAPDGRLLMVNAAFESIFGYRPDEVVGRQLLELVHPDDRAATGQAACEVMEGRARQNFRNRYLCRDGSVVDMQWSARWLPEYGMRIGVGHEVTALRDFERQLEHLASHDPLTGLPNRHHLQRELDKALLRAAADSEGLALLYIDLDGFKDTNDRLGHQAGDQLLCEVALQLRQGLRQGDLIARIGGDEFIAVLPGCGDSALALEIAQLLRAQLSGCADHIDGITRVDASIGVACFPADGTTIDALLRHADSAMYATKAGKRCRSLPAPTP